VAPVVGEGGGDVKAPGPMTGPGGTNLGRVVGYDELSCRVDGVGDGHGCRAMPIWRDLGQTV
jgi:hypothetical protein